MSFCIPGAPSEFAETEPDLCPLSVHLVGEIGLPNDLFRATRTTDRFPQSTQIIGADDDEEACTVSTTTRGVHRVYRKTAGDGVWRMLREAPGFNPRFIGRIWDRDNMI